VACLEAAALAGAAPSIRDEVEAAAALAERLAAEWGPDGDEDGAAKALARQLHGTVPVIAGGELLAPVAYRWKCQLNENSSLPAFSAPLPEAGHNEVAAWPASREFGPFSAVFLEDPDADPRDSARSEMMSAIAAEGARVVERVPARGESRLERLVSLVLLGDLVSLYLAVLSGVDPADVEPLDRLKAALTAR
jgi:glucose/mannose-6-phosphate isomerase